MLLLIHPIVTTLAALTVVGLVIAAGLALLRLAGLRSPRAAAIAKNLAPFALVSMLIVASLSTAGSLFFSEIAEFIPCKLCWFQRVFMYPLPLLLIFAFPRPDRSLLRGVLALSFVGILFSTWHLKEQWQAILNPEVFDPLKPCDLTGVSCAATEIQEFGFVTIPLMAWTAFALLIIGCWYLLSQRDA